MNKTNLKAVGQRTITPHEARILEKSNFVLEFKMMHIDGTDTYNVYVKDIKNA